MPLEYRTRVRRMRQRAVFDAAGSFLIAIALLIGLAAALRQRQGAPLILAGGAVAAAVVIAAVLRLRLRRPTVPYKLPANAADFASAAARLGAETVMDGGGAVFAAQNGTPLRALVLEVPEFFPEDGAIARDTAIERCTALRRQRGESVPYAAVRINLFVCRTTCAILEDYLNERTLLQLREGEDTVNAALIADTRLLLLPAVAAELRSTELKKYCAAVEFLAEKLAAERGDAP